MPNYIDSIKEQRDARAAASLKNKVQELEDKREPLNQQLREAFGQLNGTANSLRSVAPMLGSLDLKDEARDIDNVVFHIDGVAKDGILGTVS